MFEDWTTITQQSDCSSTSKVWEQPCKHKGPESSLMKRAFSNVLQKDTLKKPSPNKLAIGFPTTMVTPVESVLFETYFFICILTCFYKGDSSNHLKNPPGWLSPTTVLSPSTQKPGGCCRSCPTTSCSLALPAATPQPCCTTSQAIRAWSVCWGNTFCKGHTVMISRRCLFFWLVTLGRQF